MFDLSLGEWITVAAASWTILAIAGGFTIGRFLRFADERTPTPPPPDPDATADDVDDDAVSFPSYPPPVPAPRCRFEADLSSPLDLTGFELDARFYAVLAPSFREYQ